MNAGQREQCGEGLCLLERCVVGRREESGADQSLGLKGLVGANHGSRFLLSLRPSWKAHGRAWRGGEKGAAHINGNSQEHECCLMPDRRQR